MTNPDQSSPRRRASSSTRTVPFRQADLSRALKGAKAAGMAVARAEIEPGGKIILVAVDGAPASAPVSDLDQWLRGRDARKA